MFLVVVALLLVWWLLWLICALVCELSFVYGLFLVCGFCLGGPCIRLLNCVFIFCCDRLCFPRVCGHLFCSCVLLCCWFGACCVSVVLRVVVCLCACL